MTPRNLFPQDFSFILQTLDASTKQTFPRYDIYKNQTKISDIVVDTYHIDVALAGFKKEDLSINLEAKSDHSVLTIEGKQHPLDAYKQTKYIENGISKKSFNIGFVVGNDLQLDNTSFKDGLLSINFTHKPLKPNKIQVSIS